MGQWDSRGLLYQLLELGEGLGGGVLCQEVADGSGALLNAVYSVLVWACDAAGLDGVDLLHQPVGLVGQLANDGVPLGETLMAAHAVGELAREASSTGVTPGTRHTLHTHAVTRHLVALGLRGAPSVTVAS